MSQALTIVLLLSIALSGCGKIDVHQLSHDTKRIELSEVPRVSYPPEASYAHPESQMALSTAALTECPGGYHKVKEQYVPDRGDGRDMMVWIVKCSK